MELNPYLTTLRNRDRNLENSKSSFLLKREFWLEVENEVGRDNGEEAVPLVCVRDAKGLELNSGNWGGTSIGSCKIVMDKNGKNLK